MNDLTEKNALFEEVIITRSEYKRMQTAEILLRLLLTADISIYSSCTDIIEVMRKIYGVAETEDESNAEQG